MRTFLALSLVVLTGCGSNQPKPEEPATSASAAPAESASAAPEAKPSEEEKDAKKIPEGCDGGGDKASCVMPSAFVRNLCAGSFPDLALMFFQKGTPWRRMYVAVKEAAPFNGLGGPASDEKLVFDEELLVLREKKVDTGGMQVSGAGSSFDVLRWDGTCATMSAEEVRPNLPPKAKHAPIPWRILEDATQNALRKNEALDKTASERRKECKGATMGEVSAKCEKADKKLNDLIADAVRGGTEIPKPAKVP